MLWFPAVLVSLPTLLVAWWGLCRWLKLRACDRDRSWRSRRCGGPPRITRAEGVCWTFGRALRGRSIGRPAPSESAPWWRPIPRRLTKRRIARWSAPSGRCSPWIGGPRRRRQPTPRPAASRRRESPNTAEPATSACPRPNCGDLPIVPAGPRRWRNRKWATGLPAGTCWKRTYGVVSFKPTTPTTIRAMKKSRMGLLDS